MQGFIQIPRSLLEHPTVQAAPLAQYKLLFTIIEYACFKPCQQDDHQVLIDLKPGQFMCTERGLAKLAGISRNDVQRGIDRFSKVKILSQEVIHTKQIITITHKDTYDLINKSYEPTSEPKVSQERAKSEPEKNKVIKKERKKRIKEIKKEKIAFGDHVLLTQEEFDILCEKHGKEIINNKIEQMNYYISSKGKKYESHFYTLEIWLKKDKKENENIAKPQQGINGKLTGTYKFKTTPTDPEYPIPADAMDTGRALFS